MRFWRIFTLLLVVAVAGINLWRIGLDSFHWGGSPTTTAVYRNAFPALFAVVVAWLIGALLAGLLWPRRGEAALVLSVGAGVGLGVTSLIFFLASRFSAQPSLVAFPVEVLLSCVLLFCWLRKMRTAPPPPAGPRPARSWLGSLVLGVFVAAGPVALYSLAVTWRGVPAELCGGSLPGQLPLVPAGMARSLAYTGTATPLAGGLHSAMFSLATVGLLVAGVHRLRNRLIALTGGLVLLGTPFFSRFTPVEHADIPFGFFLLAATVLVSIARDEDDRGVLFLAGLAAGLAAWTKGEGLLFCASLGLVFGAAQLRAGRGRNLLPLLGGMVPVLAPLLLGGMASVAATGLQPGGSTGGRDLLADWSRHRLILQAGGRDLLHFGEWYSLPFLVMALPLIGPVSGWLERRIVVAAALLLLLLAGCYTAYLLGPSNLAEQLDVSLARLFMQVWPAAVFLWCLLAVRAAPAIAPKSPVESPAGSPADR